MAVVRYSFISTSGQEHIPGNQIRQISPLHTDMNQHLRRFFAKREPVVLE
jgi:hypothetical protein